MGGGISGVGTSADALGRVHVQIDADFDDHLESIRSYLRQPSVSGTGQGILQGAEATASLIEAAGGQAEIVKTPGHPAVLGRIEGAGPRLVRYGMYDVQPAEEPDWTSPPFAAEIRDLPRVGRSVVARGAANSKGCLAAFFLAVKSATKVSDLPVSIALLIDGEEELGSPNLPRVVDERRADLVADAAFDLDLGADTSGVPDVYLGCKGIISVLLACRGGDWGGPAERALHSSQGVVVASPAWSLVRALGALVNQDESPRVAGLAPPPISDEDQELVDALAARIDMNEQLREAGARRYKKDVDARALIRALLYEPAVNLNGVATGYPAGGKTIIPHEARAVLDIRVPYGCDIDAICNGVKEAVATAAPEAEVDVKPFEVCPPSKTSPSSPVARALVQSHVDAGRPARVWPGAPWWAPYYLFEQKLELPFAVGGAGHSARAHAADEYATVAGLREHMHQSITFLHRFAGEFEAA